MAEELENLNKEYLKLKKEFLVFIASAPIKEVSVTKTSGSENNRKKYFDMTATIKYANQLLKFAQECVKKTDHEHAKKLVLKTINQEIINLTSQIQKMAVLQINNIYDEIHTLLVLSHTKIERKVSLIANNKEYLEKLLITRSMNSLPSPQAIADKPQIKFKI